LAAVSFCLADAGIQCPERVVIASDAQSCDEHMQERVKHIKYGEMLDNVR
jgi:hypothetical protein